jgi:endonuclease YncB( thermonuclease family)
MRIETMAPFSYVVLSRWTAAMPLRLLVLLALCGPTAWADVLEGRVVTVADGDTITLLDSNRQQHRIRLAGIDAPEKAQPFGQRSKQHLSELAWSRC